MFRESLQVLSTTVLCVAAGAAQFRAETLQLRTNDVVAFVGGADLAAAQETGHVEALLAVAFPGARFRNFGWEGHTVFAQPRDVGFPALAEQLKRSGATVIFVQFGRAEVLNRSRTPAQFASTCRKFLDASIAPGARAVLVTPVPFENGGGLLPDLSKRNPELAEYAEAIRGLARERKLPVVDLFAEVTGKNHAGQRMTSDGLQLTSRGHALVAIAFARQLGLSAAATRAGEPDASGAWRDARFEQLRQTVIAKNRLWFDYWRPQNWAFLGGDRIEQPSSRDHRDLKVRWFPAEMEKFVPLIEEKEREIELLARQLGGAR